VSLAIAAGLLLSRESSDAGRDKTS